MLKRLPSLYLELIKSLLVGCMCFAVDFGLLYVLTQFIGLYYLVSAAIGYSAGICTNYLLSINWVFSKRRVTHQPLEFAIFVLIGLSGLLCNTLLMWGFTDLFGVNYLISKGIATVMIYFYNFVIRKLLLFR